jgi:mycoredoxin
MDEPRITMYSRPLCSDCVVAKATFDRLGVGYQEINVREDPAAREVVLRINDGLGRVPTILFPSGRIVVEPTARELEAVLRDEGLLDDAPAA